MPNSAGNFTDTDHQQMKLAEARMVESLGRLAAAEQSASTQRELKELEVAYLVEEAAYRTALASAMVDEDAIRVLKG
jgi:hypothetical protein